MLAVIELGGNQFMVQKGDIIEVKKQDVKEKSKISIPALLVSDPEGKETKVGTPEVEGSKVELKVLEQIKGDKVRVFKMKSKKRHMKNKWFRASLTRMEVVSVA